MTCSESRREEFDQVLTTARVAPFVVVPRQLLDTVGTDHAAVAGVQNRGMLVGSKVDGNQFFLRVLQNALHGAFGSTLHDGVHGNDREDFRASFDDPDRESFASTDKFLCRVSMNEVP